MKPNNQPTENQIPSSDAGAPGQNRVEPSFNTNNIYPNPPVNPTPTGTTQPPTSATAPASQALQPTSKAGKHTGQKVLVGLGVSVAIVLAFRFVVPHRFQPTTIYNGLTKGKELALIGTELTMYVPDELDGLSFGASLLDDHDQGKKNASKTGTFKLSEFLETKEPCTISETNPPLGRLYRIAGKYENEKDRKLSKGELIKQFDNFFVTYDTPESACAAKPAIETKASQLRPKIKEALKSIQVD